MNLFFYWDGTQWVQVGSGAGDNWGTQVVQTSGTNISGDGTTANPLTVTDGDSDPTNEIELPSTATTNQVLTWDGTNWVAQNVPSGADNWGTQVVQTSGTNISGDGTATNPLTVTDGDTDATNEIELPTGGTNGQVLSTDGSGNYTWINDNAGTDDQNIQNLAFDANTNILTVGIENGNSQTVDLTALLNDADSDPNNEIQDLSLNTTTNILTITNNGTPTSIDLTPYLDNTDNQDLSLTGNTLSLTNDGTTVDLSGYLDNTDSQNLSNTTSGNNVTLNISGGTGTTFSINDADSDPTNEIELPTGGTNGQVLSTNGSGTYTWVMDNAGTDNQDLSLTGNTLSLTNDGTPVDLSGYLDNTDNQNISGSGLSGTVLTIGIQNGTNETVDLASLTDADWYKVGTTAAPASINDNIFTQGRVGIGTNNPKSNLDIVGTRKTTIYPSNSIFKMGGADVFLYGGAHSGGLGVNYPIMLQAMRDSDSLQFPISLNPNGGNIGVGTLSPTEALHVVGNEIIESWDAVLKSKGPTHDSIYHLIGTYQGWDNSGIYIAGYNYYNPQGGNVINSYAKKVHIGRPERLTVDLQTGNTGMGTTTPTSKLHVNGGIRTQNMGQIVCRHYSGGSVVNVPFTRAYVASHPDESYIYTGVAPDLQDNVQCNSGANGGNRFYDGSPGWDGQYFITLDDNSAGQPTIYGKWIGWNVRVDNAGGAQVVNGNGEITFTLWHDGTNWRVQHMSATAGTTNCECR